MNPMIHHLPGDVEHLLRDGAWFRRIARALVAPDEAGLAVTSSSASSRRPLSRTPESTEEAVACAELRLDVVSTVLRLAEPWRTAVILRHLEGRSVPAIGRLTRTPESIVRERVRRGLALARATLRSMPDRDSKHRSGTTAHPALGARLERFACDAAEPNIAGRRVAPPLDRDPSPWRGRRGWFLR